MLNNSLLAVIESHISTYIDGKFQVEEIVEINGGDINKAYLLKGKPLPFFLKINQGKPSDFFEKEADGLHLLSIAKHSLKVPKPLVWGEKDGQQYLVMEYLEEGEPDYSFFEKLGKGMAELHQNTIHFFGLQEDNYLGSQPQLNGKYEKWSTFYAKQRMLPQAERAFNNQLLTTTDVEKMERLCGQLENIFPKEKPALLHGDFWNGNYSCTKDSTPCIFDPAVYYGCREMDIAMSILFGGFDQSFYSAYNSVYPLLPEWEDRIELCQLYPLLMHLNHFGMGYYERVHEIISKY